jgi:acetolactate synthase-1/3 small subunit
MQKRILSLLVDNNPGVTSRVSGLFSRRGYNIESFSSGPTTDEHLTRITIVCCGDAIILEQIVKQLEKLVDVREIRILHPEDSVIRELVLVKVSARPDQRQGIISVTDIFRANIVDVSNDSLIIEMTGSKSKVEAFIRLMMDYEILELARTGVTGLSRGMQLQ